MIGVSTPEVEGVTLRRHVLDLEAAAVAMALRKLGNRVRFWLRSTAEHHTLPDADTRETIELWRRGVMDLLKEQRERARLTPKNGAPVLTDDEARVAMRDYVLEAVRSMPEDELQLMLASRRAKDAVAVERPEGEP